ncbi:MAG: DNA alkylation repair protein [Candidatus Limnocylindrales bacterium]
MTSDISKRAAVMVADRMPEAVGLGTALVDLIDDPESFVRVLREGLERLSDAQYAAEQSRVAPGSGAIIGVRWPFVHAVQRQLKRPLEEGSSASALWLAQRLAVEDLRELRSMALTPLARTLPDDPERSWQVLRRLGRAANDWICVDTMASLVATGIILEPYRWAELEQLVYSESQWERRLVGATVARMPFEVPTRLRGTLDASRGLMLIKSLMGDRVPSVQKALSWALREWIHVDREAVGGMLTEETDVALANDDGHRAWVIRDALSAQPATLAQELRKRLAGIRRRPGAPSTSAAGKEAARFLSMIDQTDRAVAEQGERMARAAR